MPGREKRLAQAPPPVMPTMPPPAPVQLPAAPVAPAAVAQPPIDRKQQVRAAIAKLRELIQTLSRSIFQMELKEEQLRELAQKILQELAKAVGEITTERVKQIAGDFLIVEAAKKIAQIHQIGSQVIWQADPFTTMPATIRRVSLMGGKPFYTIELQSKRSGYPRLVEDVGEQEIVAE